MSVATSTAIIMGGALLAGGTVASSELQSHAANTAADLQTQAATHAADVQGVSTQAALDFQKQQAAQDLASAQAASLGNYQQWAAKQGRLSSLGQSVGLAPFQIPAYVPIPNVNAGTPTPAGAPGMLSPNTMSTLGTLAQQLAPNASANPAGQPGIQPLQFVPAPGAPATPNPYVTSLGTMIRPPSV